MPTEGLTITEAQKKLEHYCAYQERCHQEVNAKLKSYGMIPAARDQIIGHLITQNYLNESRFAQSFTRGKFRIKKWGKERIERELKFKQISPYNIRLGLLEIDPTEYLETLESLAQKFWDTHINKPLSLRKKKVYTALKYRGWETDHIFDCLNRLESETDAK
ncbi:MAG: regulatory protein RecX [Flavobacteriaceae bacterium]|nr:regulatory protein RecX [Flavobacteriaceae bacterium]